MHAVYLFVVVLVQRAQIVSITSQAATMAVAYVTLSVTFLNYKVTICCISILLNFYYDNSIGFVLIIIIYGQIFRNV